MKLLSLDIQRFRNITQAALRPSPRINVLFGKNGQGKTNFLEAIHLLTTLKSFRSTRLSDLIQFGENSAVVRGDLEIAPDSRQIEVSLSPGSRIACLDGKPQDRLDIYFDGLSAVCFSPDDILLVKGGPETRRRFLDRAAFNRWPAVLNEARDYVRSLRERNAALRSGDPDVEGSFRIPLIRAATRLMRRRRDIVAELGPRLASAYAQISGPGAPVASLAYRPASIARESDDEATIAARLEELLSVRLERDRERGYTSAGPHTDDLVFTLDGHGARPFASQGRQRALVLALKIAEIENLRTVLGRPPLLLLDDVSSELDPTKNRYLLEYLAELPAQVFLTATDPHLLEAAVGPDSLFCEVEEGRFSSLFSS